MTPLLWFHFFLTNSLLKAGILFFVLLEGNSAPERLLGPKLPEQANVIMNLSLQGPVFLPIKWI